MLDQNLDSMPRLLWAGGDTKTTFGWFFH